MRADARRAVDNGPQRGSGPSTRMAGRSRPPDLNKADRPGGPRSRHGRELVDEVGPVGAADVAGPPQGDSRSGRRHSHYPVPASGGDRCSPPGVAAVRRVLAPDRTQPVSEGQSDLDVSGHNAAWLFDTDTGSPSRPIPANLIVTSRGVELTPALAGAAVIRPGDYGNCPDRGASRAPGPRPTPNPGTRQPTLAAPVHVTLPGPLPLSAPERSHAATMCDIPLVSRALLDNCGSERGMSNRAHRARCRPITVCLARLYRT
jgi:hypothetical protein